MDIEAVRNTLEQASLASLAIGLAIGFFFSFNPVALAAIAVSLAYMTKAQAPQRTVLLGSMFVLGMIVTHALLGLVVGLGGGWIQRFIGREWGLALGPASIVLGLAWPGWIRLPIPQIPLRARRTASTWGAIALGASFSGAGRRRKRARSETTAFRKSWRRPGPSRHGRTRPSHNAPHGESCFRAGTR